MQRKRDFNERDRSMRYRRTKQMIKLFGLIVATQSIYLVAIINMRNQRKNNGN